MFDSWHVCLPRALSLFPCSETLLSFQCVHFQLTLLPERFVCSLWPAFWQFNWVLLLPLVKPQNYLMMDYTPSFLNLISRPKGTYLFILLILFFSRLLCSILFIDLYNTRSQHHPHLWNSSFPLELFNLALPT